MCLSFFFKFLFQDSTVFQVRSIILVFLSLRYSLLLCLSKTQYNFDSFQRFPSHHGLIIYMFD